MSTSNEMFGGQAVKRYVSPKVMTAEEARVKTASAARIKTETELLPVFDKIDESCRNGMFYANYEGILSKLAIERLNQLGYECEQIKPSHPVDEEFIQNGIKISWEKII